jgi:hypothetical protein
MKGGIGMTIMTMKATKANGSISALVMRPRLFCWFIDSASVTSMYPLCQNSVDFSAEGPNSPRIRKETPAAQSEKQGMCQTPYESLENELAPKLLNWFEPIRSEHQ